MVPVKNIHHPLKNIFLHLLLGLKFMGYIGRVHRGRQRLFFEKKRGWRFSSGKQLGSVDEKKSENFFKLKNRGQLLYFGKI